ncbi:MAG: SHOCT domain-containing protein [Candidatus Humimicrobiaceae bacterium]
MMCGWPNMMGGFYGGGLGWIGMVLGFIFFILVVIGIIFLIAWLVKRSNYPGVENRTESKALEVLKERYAKGEITKDQFDNMRKDLN